MNLKCWLGMHDFSVKERLIKERKRQGRTEYDVVEVTRCSRCGRAKDVGGRCEVVLGAGLSQAKAKEVVRWNTKK